MHYFIVSIYYEASISQFSANIHSIIKYTQYSHGILSTEVSYNVILTFFVFSHGWLQRAVVDDHFGRGHARRARRLASAAAARLPPSHLLRTRTTDKQNQSLNYCHKILFKTIAFSSSTVIRIIIDETVCYYVIVC